MKAPVLLVLISVGCTGLVGGAAGQAGAGGGTGTIEGCVQGASAPTTRVRRLTKVELQNAMAALIDDRAMQALGNLDADSQINDRYSNSDQLVASASFVGG